MRAPRQRPLALVVRATFACCLQAIKTHSDVWLVDHAFSFTDFQEAVEELRGQVMLLQRLAALVEVPWPYSVDDDGEPGSPAEDQAACEAVLQQVVDRLHTVVYEFVLQASAEQRSTHKYRRARRSTFFPNASHGGFT